MNNVPIGCPFTQTFPGFLGPDITRSCIKEKSHPGNHVVIEPRENKPMEFLEMSVSTTNSEKEHTYPANVVGYVNEFHARLKRNVRKLTCDVPKSEAEVQNLISMYTPNDRDRLTLILWKELQQVIQAVEEAK